MKLFAIAMFVAIGLIAGYLANKVTEGAMPLITAMGVAGVGALAGGWVAAIARVHFYGLLGWMVVASACALLCLLVWRKARG